MYRKVLNTRYAELCGTKINNIAALSITQLSWFQSKPDPLNVTVVK